MLILQKYGGSSLADWHKLLRAAQRVAGLHRAGHRVVVVVSAQGDTTDELIQRVSGLTQGASKREMDAYMACGEQLSAGLMAMALESLDCPAVSLTGWQMGLQTDNEHGSAHILGLAHDRIARELDGGRVVVAAGFQGLNSRGDITTLGRGGSDTTAVALAAFLKADRCQIFTDVDGVYDKDPRKHPDAVRYGRIGYSKMLEMARSGAQVLHDRCVELAQKHGVVIEVLSSFREGPGTFVGPMD